MTVDLRITVRSSKQVHCYLKQTATSDILKELLNSKNSYSSKGSWSVGIFSERADIPSVNSNEITVEFTDNNKQYN